MTTAELMLAATDDDTPWAAVTGQIVVVSPMVLVTRTVWTAAGPRDDCSAEISDVAVAAGQLVMVAAHETMVCSCVTWTVSVVCSPSAVTGESVERAATPEERVRVDTVVETGTISVEMEVLLL